MDVLMPQLGETVAEGKISTWFKQVGDPVKPGDNLFEIETDKVSMEVPAIATGVLAEIRVPAGAVAPVGAVVAVLSLNNVLTTPQSTSATPQVVATGAPPKTPIAPRRAPETTPGVAGESAPPSPARPIRIDPFFEVRTPERNYGPARLPSGAVATPLARRLAGERGIDLTRVSGSGPRGRIVARDVEQARAKAPPAAPSAGPTAAEIKVIYADTPYEEVPLDNMRRTIAARLVVAKQTIPHFYLTADVEIERLLQLRAEANEAAPKDKDGVPAFKLSVNDFILTALALALQRVPTANAVWAA